MNVLISLISLVILGVEANENSLKRQANINYEKMNNAIKDFSESNKKDRRVACLNDELLITEIEKTLIRPVEKLFSIHYILGFIV